MSMRINSPSYPQYALAHSVSIIEPFAYKRMQYVQRLLVAVSLCFLLSVSTDLLSAEQSESDQSGEHKRGEFSGAMETVYPDWFKISFMELEEDVAEAAEEGKRLMLLFHQNGCPYCNAFVEKNLAQKDIEDTLKTKFDVIEFNLWGDREVISVDGEIYSEKNFAAALGVQFTPTILFLTEDGGLSLRLNGYYGPDQFRAALDYVSNGMEKTQSFADYIAERVPEESSKKLIERAYFSGPVTDLAERPGKGEKPLLVMFEQGSCKNCETLHDKILASDQSQNLLNRFDVYQVDMWGRDEFSTPEGENTTGREWSKALNVSYAPTLILYDKDGKEVIRSEAFFKTFHTQSILDYVSTEAYQEEPSFQRYLSARAESLQEQGIDVNIWDAVEQ